MSPAFLARMKMYQATAIFSVLFALIGFSYNVWRMESSEQNSNVRTACFELLLQLSELEQLVYSAHYDKNPDEGSPRKGWVKVGLIVDLSKATDSAVGDTAVALRSVWSDNWESMAENKKSADAIVSAIDATRARIQSLLASLR